jgi:hypothetical protein
MLGATGAGSAIHHDELLTFHLTAVFPVLAFTKSFASKAKFSNNHWDGNYERAVISRLAERPCQL